MNDEAALDARIAELEEQLATPLAVVEADSLVRDALAAYQNGGNGDGQEDRRYKRFRDLLDERNRIFFRTTRHDALESVALQVELRQAQAELAKLRSEPFLMRIKVNKAELVEGSKPEMLDLQPDLSGSGEFLLQSEFGPPALAFNASLWSGQRQHA